MDRKKEVSKPPPSEHGSGNTVLHADTLSPRTSSHLGWAILLTCDEPHLRGVREGYSSKNNNGY